MNPYKPWKRLQNQQGAALVEFAVVLPMLLLLLFGIIEFGRVLSVSHSVNSAAREGARVASLPGSDNDSVLAAIQNDLALAGLAVDSVEFDPIDISTASPDQPVTVRVIINYESVGWVQGFIPGFSGGQLQGVVVMRKEGLG